jgi:hypothetical protein
LLVDDIFDSRWTLTVAGFLIAQHGGGPVYPFALAKAADRRTLIDSKMRVTGRWNCLPSKAIQFQRPVTKFLKRLEGNDMQLTDDAHAARRGLLVCRA